MRFLHSIVTPNTDLAASASITPFDLPVNPLSMLLLRLELTNTNPATMDLYSAIDDAVTQITAIRILHKGEQIISGSLRDLMVLNAVYQHAYPGSGRLAQTSAAVRSLVFPLCFGRRPYDPMSCFPATTRGNLRFELDAGADGAGYSDINFSLEAVELIEADPKEYVKYTTNARTSVVGQFDAPLPIGNPLLGILMFDTGLGGSDDGVLSWGTVKLLKDNVEQYYPLSDYEVIAGQLATQMGASWHLFAGHKHGFIAPGPAADISDDAHLAASESTQGYAFLDFDPLRDGSYQLETSGAADLKIRGTGDEATAVRYLPIERVMVT
jgi:hypothetical protein